jgi:PAS domain S-box-containing protein
MVTRASAAGIWEWRIVEDRMQLSPRLARMTGVGDQDLGSGIDSWVDLVVHAEDRVEFRSMLRGHVELGKPFDVRVRVRWASGEYRWVHCNGVAARDAENRATVMAGSVIDVHEQHQAEERLERHAQDLLEANEVLEAQAKELASKSAEEEASRAAADAANRAKSDFLAHLSHEIRTPMTAILGFADVLAEEARSGPALSAWLDHLLTIRRNGEHLLGLVNDVLDMSKIEAGRMTVERIACSPMGVARDVVAMLGERAGAKGLALRLEAGEDVPALILTDPLRLRQILTNLVGNAVKFTERGSVTVRICRDDDHLAFEVIDTGIGLTSEQLTRLFLPFEQADATTARRFGGTGLGLAISSKLAELLGGGVEAYSTPGEGSRFVLTIKAPVAAAASPVEAEAGGAVGASPGGSLGGSRILLAEDGPDNQRLISFHLRRAGAAVEIVGDGRAALDRALAADRSGDPYDVVLMDVQMPEMDGLAATRALRQAGYRGAILALTASAMSGDRERCLEAGCDDYAAKPIDRDALLAACGRWSRERVERVAA